jgi:DNA primase
VADDWEALKKQVKEANDIVEVVGTYVSLRQQGQTYKGLCPFHDDHRPSFDVDPRRQRYKCWPCGKSGDVISFIQEHEHVGFREALELLARRAGISLEKSGAFRQNTGRAVMLDLGKWAGEQYHQCLLESPLAEEARRYLGDRRLTSETVRRFCLGFAPPKGGWLAERAARAGHSLETLEKIGLLARRLEGTGYFDRFRDRVLFPIRNASSQTVGFGGRILPSSPLSARAPKYLNSSESPVFTKGEHLYGLDQARQAAAAVGYLAVVEGYTDVLMAHQMGIPQVVSTMGTALNARHVRHLRRYLPSGKVILVFDADAGGYTGVDRALEIFVSQEVDLAIATLPAGMDPCDLLAQQGPDAFRQILADAVDALDFKLRQVLGDEKATGIEGRRRAVDAILGVIALAPEMTGPGGAVKRELTISRIAQRLSLREETLWERLSELRSQRRTAAPSSAAGKPERKAAASPRERQLLEVLLAEPKLVAIAADNVSLEEIDHPGLRELLEGLYSLCSQGRTPDLETLQPTIENPELAQAALRMQNIGRMIADRPGALSGLVSEFKKKRSASEKQELQNQLQAASDHTEAVELLKQLQQRTVGLEPDALPLESPGS